MQFESFLKNLFLLVSILVIAIPLRYGSTNHQYLSLRLLHSILSLKHSLISDPARPTLSAEYRAFENMLRMGPLTDHDPLADPITTAKKVRSASSMSTVVPKPSHCQVNKEIFDHEGHSVDNYWVDYTLKSLQTHSEKLLVFLHGGGYVLGDVNSELLDIFRRKTNFFFCSNRL